MAIRSPAASIATATTSFSWLVTRRWAPVARSMTITGPDGLYLSQTAIIVRPDLLSATSLHVPSPQILVRSPVKRSHR